MFPHVSVRLRRGGYGEVWGVGMRGGGAGGISLYLSLSQYLFIFISLYLQIFRSKYLHFNILDLFK